MGTLTYTQKKILKLLDLELTQSQIAKRLNLSRQYVCQFVRKLLEKGLIEQSEKTPTGYNCMYNLIPQLKRQIEAHTKEVQFSACRVHNIRLKYPIRLTGEISTDKRTGYFMSWEMRGGTRHKYFIQGTAGKPDITIDVHLNTIVAYPDAGQTVYAESIEDSETLITASIHEAVSTFIQNQKHFGTDIEIQNPSLAGKLISKIHYGFNFRKNSPFAPEQTGLNDFWIDNSPEKNGEKGHSEFETENKAAATALDSAVIAISEAYRILGRNPFHVIYDELMEIKQELFNRKDGVIS